MVILHLIEKETETKRGSLICLRSGNLKKELGELDLNPLSATMSL